MARNLKIRSKVVKKEDLSYPLAGAFGSDDVILSDIKKILEKIAKSIVGVKTNTQAIASKISSVSVEGIKPPEVNLEGPVYERGLAAVKRERPTVEEGNPPTSKQEDKKISEGINKLTSLIESLTKNVEILSKTSETFTSVITNTEKKLQSITSNDAGDRSLTTIANDNSIITNTSEETINKNVFSSLNSPFTFKNILKHALKAPEGIGSHKDVFKSIKEIFNVLTKEYKSVFNETIDKLYEREKASKDNVDAVDNSVAANEDKRAKVDVVAKDTEKTTENKITVKEIAADKITVKNVEKTSTIGTEAKDTEKTTENKITVKEIAADKITVKNVENIANTINKTHKKKADENKKENDEYDEDEEDDVTPKKKFKSFFTLKDVLTAPEGMGSFKDAFKGIKETFKILSDSNARKEIFKEAIEKLYSEDKETNNDSTKNEKTIESTDRAVKSEDKVTVKEIFADKLTVNVIEKAIPPEPSTPLQNPESNGTPVTTIKSTNKLDANDPRAPNVVARGNAAANNSVISSKSSESTLSVKEVIADKITVRDIETSNKAKNSTLSEKISETKLIKLFVEKISKLFDVKNRKVDTTAIQIGRDVNRPAFAATSNSTKSSDSSESIVSVKEINAEKIIVKEIEKENEGNDGQAEDSGPSIDIDMTHRGKGRLGRIGKGAKALGKKALKFLKVAAPLFLKSKIIGGAADWSAGQLGLGKDEEGNDLQIDEKQDEANWQKMTFAQKIQSGLARGVEHVGDFISLDNLSRQARAGRIQRETEYLNRNPSQSVSQITPKIETLPLPSARLGTLGAAEFPMLSSASVTPSSVRRGIGEELNTKSIENVEMRDDVKSQAPILAPITTTNNVNNVSTTNTSLIKGYPRSVVASGFSRHMDMVTAGSYV